MDAKELLRRYLEQRREMGETELVLDRMTVEETLAILGARGGSAPAGTSRADIADAPPTRERVREAPPAESPPSGPPSAGDSSTARGEEETGAFPAEVDWRQALRAAGASPGTMPKKPTPRNEESPAAPPAAEASSGPTREPAAPIPPPEGRGDQPTARTPKSRATSTPAVAASGSPLPDVPAGLSVGAPAAEMFSGTIGDIGDLDTLDKIARHVAGCTRCPLYSTATNPVPGEGNPNADFMCVGEAPGATEDETGRPFIGAAGQLLTKILAAIDLGRDDVYICNVLKHRPPGNRNPRPEEVAACSPYLIRQIELIRPKVILALGTFAAQTLLDTKLSIGKLRGQVHRYYGVPLIVTYHPAALLRNPGWKRPTWEDVKLAHRILARAADADPGA